MGKSLGKKVLDRENLKMKISLLASRFSLLAFTFFVMLFSSLVNSQVIIKEKVEINPQQNVLPEYPQSYLDPCLNISRPNFYQSVYSCSGYPVEPYQQNFPWQASSSLTQLDSATIYNVDIISGTEYAYFYKVGYWDTVNNMQVYPEYIGSSLSGIMGYELAGWGPYNVYNWVGVWERTHFALYNIRFDNYDLQTAYVTVRITNTSTNDITEWHTTIVNPQYTLNNLGIDGDTVLHNRGVVVTPDIYNSLAFSCNQFGYGSCPPTNVTFNIEVIQGQEYGNIGRYNDFFGSMEYAPAYTGLSYDEFKYGTYVFTANGLQPDSTAVVRIKQSSSDTDIGSFEYTLYIKRNFLPPVSENGSIVIETNKITAMPGDTIDVLLKWEDGSNGIVDFSDWQEFSVWLADGFSYGTLLNPATGDTSDAFDVIGKDLKLIVHQNVTDANKKIIIAAETEVAILGGNRMLQNNLQPKAETKSVDKKIISNYRKVEQGGFVKEKDKTKSEETVDDEINNTDIIVGSQYLSGIKEITINPFIVEIDPPTVSAGDTARIIPKYMDSTGNYVEFDSLQTFELGILDGCPLGYLSAEADSNQYFYGVKQPFYFIADSSVDSGVVSIRVGVIDMNPQNRSLTNNDNYTPESDNLVSCANVSFIENLYVNANVVVGNECDRYPCNEVIMKPSFTYESFPNGTFNADPCSTEQAKYTYVVDGITSVIWNKVNYLDYLKIENITACYEPILDKWKFGTTKPLFPYFKIIMDVCLTNITNKGFKPLEDIADIKDPTKWNDPNICAAKKDLEGHRSYPGKLRPGGYAFLEVTMAHEMAHGQDFQWVIDSLQNAFLYSTLNSLEIHCGNFDIVNRTAGNKEEAKSVYLSEFQKIVMGETLNGVIIKNGFEQKLKEGYNNHIKQNYTVNGITVDHENYINTRPIVVNTIDVLITEFKNIWNCK